MVKKFECKSCKKHFEADDQHMVVCPHCHSDNVDIDNPRRISGRTWKIILSICSVLLVGCAVFYFHKRNQTPKPTPTTTVCPGGNGSSVGSGYTDQDPTTVRVSEPMWDNKSMYSVEVTAQIVDDRVKFYYVMLSHFGQKVLQKNEDGHFSNIPFSNEDGHSYDFAIKDSKTDTLLCVPVEQTGFVKQITIDDDKKMTVEQLQKLIDEQNCSLNGVGENAYLAPDYEIEFTNLPKDMKKPDSWSEMFELIGFDICQGFTVTNLSYDEKKRINKVTLKISF